MRLVIAAIAVIALGVLGLSSFGGGQPVTQGELRCEGAGGVIINVDGKDYAVNGMAGPQLRIFGTAPLTHKPT